jgi:hypothetical protein
MGHLFCSIRSSERLPFSSALAAYLVAQVRLIVTFLHSAHNLIHIPYSPIVPAVVCSIYRRP